MRERVLGGLVRNLSAGTRLALFLPVRWLQFRATPGQYTLLVAFNFVVWAISASVQGEGGTLNGTAIALYFAQIPLLFLSCLAVATIVGKPSLILLLAVALSASDLAFELASVALMGAQSDPAAQFASWLALVAWGWLVAVRAAVGAA